jgi:hypothetical protein
MALTTLASVKAQMGLSPADTSKDTQIKVLIDGVSSYVKQQLNRDIEATDYVEYQSGDGSAHLVLRQSPVISVTSVCYDNAGYFGDGPNAFPAANNLTPGVEWSLLDGLNHKGGQGILRRIGSVWYGRPSRFTGTVANLPPIPAGNFKIVYRAGYEVIPPVIVMACNSLISSMIMQASVGGGASSLGYEDASVSLFDPTIAAKQWGSYSHMLSQFRSLPV